MKSDVEYAIENSSPQYFQNLSIGICPIVNSITHLIIRNIKTDLVYTVKIEVRSGTFYILEDRNIMTLTDFGSIVTIPNLKAIAILYELFDEIEFQSYIELDDIMEKFITVLQN